MALQINWCVVRGGRVQGILTPTHKGTRVVQPPHLPAGGSGLWLLGKESLYRDTWIVPSRTPLRPPHTLGNPKGSNDNCTLLTLTLSNRALKIHASTDTSWTKLLPQTERAPGFTGSLCSRAAGSAVSTGWARQGSEIEICTFWSLCEKGPEFLTVISGQCHEEEVAQGKAPCHCHTQALHRNLLCIPTSPPGASPPQGTLQLPR